MSSTIENLQWRYAVKQYDTTKKLTDEERALIMEALRLAPSSMGLQPWKFVHVTNSALREQLKAAAWNQPAVTDASDLFVICSLADIDEAYVDAFMKQVAAERGVSLESLKGYREMCMGVVNLPEQDRRIWCMRQTYVALGVALAVAAEHHIDSTPMEGFDAASFDQILGLTELGLQSRMLLAVGFRSTDDKYQTLKKIRFATEDVFIER